MLMGLWWGSPISGSPFAMEVETAAASAVHCVVSGSALDGGVVGEEVHVSIVVYDEYGNMRTEGAENMVVQEPPRFLVHALSPSAPCVR